MRFIKKLTKSNKLKASMNKKITFAKQAAMIRIKKLNAAVHSLTASNQKLAADAAMGQQQLAATQNRAATAESRARTAEALAKADEAKLQKEHAAHVAAEKQAIHLKKVMAGKLKWLK